MTRLAIEVADIARAQERQFPERYQSSLSYQQLKAYRAVVRCRTAALGGHVDVCHGCGYQTGISYNSCRSRCCPKCQAQARQRWIEAQQRNLLPTGYFHVVFTVPHQLTLFALTSPAAFYDLLFSGQLPDPAGGGSRSEVAGGGDRLPRHTSQLGFEPVAASPCSSSRRLRGLPVLVHEASRRVWGLRLRRTVGTRDCDPARVAFRQCKSVGVLIASFRSSIPSPPVPLFTLRRAPCDAQRKTRGRVVRYSLLVGLFHSLLHAGCSEK